MCVLPRYMPGDDTSPEFFLFNKRSLAHLVVYDLVEMAGSESAPRGLWPRDAFARPGDSTPPRLISIAIARWLLPPDSSVNGVPLH